MNFTLSEMENIYNEAYEYYNVYKSAIKELDTVINNMSDSWLGSACSDRHIYVAMYHQGIASNTFETDYVGGVRPVIEIPTSEIS